MKLIDKDAVAAEIENIKNRAQTLGDNAINRSMQQFYDGMNQGCVDILSSLDALEVKEVESLHDMLKYNIGVFDYQKFMEVNSLYDDLTKILDHETDRQR